jgi:hypothetical protein
MDKEVIIKKKDNTEKYGRYLAEVLVTVDQKNDECRTLANKGQNLLNKPERSTIPLPFSADRAGVHFEAIIETDSDNS